MSKLILFLIAVSFICSPLASSCAGKKSSGTTVSQTEELAGFKTTDDWNKLDGRFKMAFDKALSENEKDKQFECLIKTSAKPTEDDKNILKTAGFMHRSVSGNILTGYVKIDNVPSVAKLEFVKVMELAVPLSPKK